MQSQAVELGDQDGKVAESHASFWLQLVHRYNRSQTEDTQSCKAGRQATWILCSRFYATASICMIATSSIL